VTEWIASLLRSVGITVHLTRGADLEVGNEKRVMICESYDSDLLVSVSHRLGPADGAWIGHYPGSRGGSELSRHIAREMFAISGVEATIHETADYLIQQTSCPAVRTEFTSIGGIDEEGRLAETLEVWRRAYVVVCGVLGYLEIDEATTFSVTGRIASDGGSSQRGLVIVDGVFQIPTDETGHFDLRLLEKGDHTAQAFTRSGQSQITSFDEKTEMVVLKLD
jgi:hypothetical protein